MPAPKGSRNAAGNKGGKGGPSLYKEEYSKLAYRMCLLGHVDTDLALVFGVSEVTINAWKKKHPEFAQALIDGKAIADGNVAEKLYQKAIGFTMKEQHIIQYQGQVTEIIEIDKEVAPDTAAIRYWLNNRQSKKWRDKQEIEHSGSMVMFTGESDLED